MEIEFQRLLCEDKVESALNLARAIDIKIKTIITYGKNPYFPNQISIVGALSLKLCTQLVNLAELIV